MNFFLEKQLINFSCTYQPLSFCKILKKFLGTIQSFEHVPFSDPKWSFVLSKNFLVQTSIITFTYLLAVGLFHCAKFKKNSYSRFGVIRLCHFWAQNGPFATIFFGKLLKSFSSTYQPLSLCKILKKFFQRIQSYEDVQFLGPKWPISPNENFFRKPVNEPCFFHSCLSTCQKSKSGINLLVKY